MAQRRMFSLQVIDTDRFMDMPLSAQALYFHLGMHGDDDGFVSSPRKIARAAGCNDGDLRLLASSGYIIPFESGVIVITDWNVNNTLKNDRYHETVYTEERSQISLDSSGKYILGTNMVPEVFHLGSNTEPEHNLTKHNKTESVADKPPRARFVPPTVEEVQAYCAEKGYSVDPQLFVAHYETNGWVQSSGRPIKNWKSAVVTWDRRDKASGKVKEADNATEKIIIF